MISLRYMRILKIFNKYFFSIVFFITIFTSCSSKGNSQNEKVINNKKLLSSQKIDSFFQKRLFFEKITYRDSLLKKKNFFYKVYKFPKNIPYTDLLVYLKSILDSSVYYFKDVYYDRNRDKLSITIGKEDKDIIKYLFVRDKKLYSNVKIAIVVINFGFYNIEDELRILSLPIKLNVAILPYFKHSKEILKEAKIRGHEILINIPMEPKYYPIISGKKREVEISNYMTDYGILVSLNTDKIKRRLDILYKFFEGYSVAGVTNFRGFKVLRDEESLGIIYDFIKQKNLYFLYTGGLDYFYTDSLAFKKGIEYIRYDGILDNSNSYKDVKRRFNKFLYKGIKKGEVVIVVRPKKITYKILSDYIDKLEARGMEFVFLSSLVIDKD